MRIEIRAIYILICALWIGAASASADEVWIENGDRITGELVRLEAKQLIFKTDYAEALEIDWEKVVLLQTDNPVSVTLQDGTIVEGRIFIRQGFTEETPSVADMPPPDILIANVKDINAQPEPTVKMRARVNAGISTERGNTDTDQVNLDAEFIARTTHQRFTIGGVLNREEADGGSTARNWRAYGIYNYFLSKRWFLYASTLFENDDFADLDLRATYGGGGGFQIFESDPLNLSVSVGVAYVTEDFIIADDDDFPAGQWVIRYDQYLFNQVVQLFHDNNGYVSFEDSHNWLINTRQGLRFPLYKGLTLTLQYNYDYNNEPSTNATSKWDSKFLLLFGYRFEN
jgi:putative salt-induced outer membrane protein YdiY